LTYTLTQAGFSIPPGVLAGIVVVLCIPSNFPHQGHPGYRTRNVTAIISKATFGRVDFLGAGILLAATLLFVAALEEAGKTYPWRSAFVISLLTISGILWIVFLAWERRLTRDTTAQEPVFPWRFVQSWVWIGMILYVHITCLSMPQSKMSCCRNALFLGAPWFVAIFQLPQKLQIVNGVSPLQAGIRLMPFTFAAPVGSMVSALIAGKMKIPPIYIVLFASVLQVIGFSLLSTLPASSELLPAQSGYEVIAGFGSGINISLLMLMTPFSVKSKDKGQ
jgi:hypothetical protein